MNGNFSDKPSNVDLNTDAVNSSVPVTSTQSIPAPASDNTTPDSDNVAPASNNTAQTNDVAGSDYLPYEKYVPKAFLTPLSSIFEKKFKEGSFNSLEDVNVNYSKLISRNEDNRILTIAQSDYKNLKNFEATNNNSTSMLLVVGMAAATAVATYALSKLGVVGSVARGIGKLYEVVKDSTALTKEEAILGAGVALNSDDNSNKQQAQQASSTYTPATTTYNPTPAPEPAPDTPQDEIVTSTTNPVAYNKGTTIDNLKLYFDAIKNEDAKKFDLMSEGLNNDMHGELGVANSIISNFNVEFDKGGADFYADEDHKIIPQSYYADRMTNLPEVMLMPRLTRNLKDTKQYEIQDPVEVSDIQQVSANPSKHSSTTVHGFVNQVIRSNPNIGAHYKNPEPSFKMSKELSDLAIRGLSNATVKLYHDKERDESVYSAVMKTGNHIVPLRNSSTKIAIQDASNYFTDVCRQNGGNTPKVLTKDKKLPDITETKLSTINNILKNITKEHVHQNTIVKPLTENARNIINDFLLNHDDVLDTEDLVAELGNRGDIAITSIPSKNPINASPRLNIYENNGSVYRDVINYTEDDIYPLSDNLQQIDNEEIHKILNVFRSANMDVFYKDAKDHLSNTEKHTSDFLTLSSHLLASRVSNEGSPINTVNARLVTKLLGTSENKLNITNPFMLDGAYSHLIQQSTSFEDFVHRTLAWKLAYSGFNNEKNVLSKEGARSSNPYKVDSAKMYSIVHATKDVDHQLSYSNNSANNAISTLNILMSVLNDFYMLATQITEYNGVYALEYDKEDELYDAEDSKFDVDDGKFDTEDETLSNKETEIEKDTNTAVKEDKESIEENTKDTVEKDTNTAVKEDKEDVVKDEKDKVNKPAGVNKPFGEDDELEAYENTLPEEAQNLIRRAKIAQKLFKHAVEGKRGLNQKEISNIKNDKLRRAAKFYYIIRKAFYKGDVNSLDIEGLIKNDE